jgi:hypothetical protein
MIIDERQIEMLLIQRGVRMKKLIALSSVLVLALMVAGSAFAQDDTGEEMIAEPRGELYFLCSDGGCEWTYNTPEEQGEERGGEWEESSPNREGRPGEQFVCFVGLVCTWVDSEVETDFGDQEFWVADYDGDPTGDWVFTEDQNIICDLAMMNIEAINEGSMTITSDEENEFRMNVVATSETSSMDASASAGGLNFNFLIEGDSQTGTTELDGQTVEYDIFFPPSEEVSQAAPFFKIGPGTYHSRLTLRLEGSLITWNTYFSIMDEDTMRGMMVGSMDFSQQGASFNCDIENTLEASRMTIGEDDTDE